ncbi:MAG TPA: DUF2914 domain-containing protein [bacterium]|nr:DUF2914 domain-containing protein [bacterium]
MGDSAAPAAGSVAPAATGFRERVRAFRERHKRLESVAFFAGGFCFDLLLLERIDSVPMLIHQGSYLLLLSILLVVDHHFAVVGEPHGRWGKVLHLRTELIHFLFGTLLNAFLVFYFKASSGIWAAVFLAGLCALLLANEMERFRKIGPVMRIALWSFAVVSWFGYLLPVVFGFLSLWLFLAATAIAAAATVTAWRISARWTKDPAWTFTRACLPGLSLQALLLGLYLLHVVPPVPLSLKRIGVYHGAMRDPDLGVIHLLSRPSPWPALLRPHGETTFLARPGDRLSVFVRVFAPRHFKDGVRVRWAWRDARGKWLETDAMPLTLTGGEEQGWSAVAWKDHWEPGRWRVRVETDDGREVGHLSFRVVPTDDDAVFDEEIVSLRAER